MKTLVRATAISIVIAVFQAATGRCSFGGALSALLTGITLVIAYDGIAGRSRIERIAILT